MEIEGMSNTDTSIPEQHYKYNGKEEIFDDFMITALDFMIRR
jgi:hypothetical protein